VHDGQERGVARVVDSYANTRVRRGRLLKDPVSQDAPTGESAAPEPSPLDAGLNASRIRLEPPEAPEAEG
jgi:hypothetical protein